MKYFLLLILICISEKISLAQSNKPLNNIYVNIAGTASWYSLNYERLFYREKPVFLSIAAGIGYRTEIILNDHFLSGGSRLPDDFYTIPVHISGNWGHDKNYFEFGLGMTYEQRTSNGFFETYFVYPFIGYRFQPIKKEKLNFRTFVSIPINGFSPDGLFFFPLGLSLGLCF